MNDAAPIDLLLQPKKRRFLRLTILEWLVLIAIVAVLCSLFVATQSTVADLEAIAETQQELKLVAEGIKAFCSDPRVGQVPYIPSRLDPSGTDPASNRYLSRLFPRTSGTTVLPAVMLEGNEVFVLMLGGPNNKGWSMDPSNPANPWGERIRCWKFEGKTIDGRDRLHDTGKGNEQFKIYTYLDRWGTPIAYFNPYRETERFAPPSYTDDCPTIRALPYPGQNLTTFQLISAGKDRQFGQKAATWTPTTAASVYPRGDPGYGDIANWGATDSNTGSAIPEVFSPLPRYSGERGRG
jgi:hypothetical protein